MEKVMIDKLMRGISQQMVKKCGNPNVKISKEVI